MGEEIGIPLNVDAPALAKLKKGPVEVEVGVFEDNPEYDPGEDKAQDPMKQIGSFPAWLHPLTTYERDLIEADILEIYRFWVKKDGENKAIARRMMTRASKRLLVFLSLRKGPEKDSPCVFSDQMEVMDYHPPTIEGLNMRYYQEFGLTDKERGNLLRARGLKISSALPATSQEPSSGELD